MIPWHTYPFNSPPHHHHCVPEEMHGWASLFSSWGVPHAWLMFRLISLTDSCSAVRGGLSPWRRSRPLRSPLIFTPFPTNINLLVPQIYFIRSAFFFNAISSGHAVYIWMPWKWKTTNKKEPSIACHGFRFIPVYTRGLLIIRISTDTCILGIAWMKQVYFNNICYLFMFSGIWIPFQRFTSIYKNISLFQ